MHQRSTDAGTEAASGLASGADSDVVIVGGGPAGLNAALVLGRCRRRVRLFDGETPRNAVSRHVNGFITRDGCPPSTFRGLGREELARYDTVGVEHAEVADATREEGGFAIVLADGRRMRARKLILATGLRQTLPEVEGFAALWGRGIHHCPYCDGFENRDAPLAIYGSGPAGKALALELTAWSRDLTLLTDGEDGLAAEDRDRLARQGVAVVTTPVRRALGADALDAVEFADGSRLSCGALFFVSECEPSPLVAKLGLDLTAGGTVRTGEYEGTNVPGLYVAGDASRRVQLAVVAAAEGAMAAFAINTELLREDTR